MALTTLFEEATARQASDIHLATGEVPRLRLQGKLVSVDQPALDRASFSALMDQTLPPDWQARMELGLPVERTVLHGDRVFAGVFFRFGDDGLAATFRILADEIPSLDLIGEGAMPLFERIAETPRGLVLITGPTGSGKWTTACSTADRINGSKAERIFVIESHPNYRFRSKQSLVTQLHVGHNLDSYGRAIEVTQQADPDVVVVDDVPTVEVLRSLLILAETGHLVIANMHAEGVVDALRRLYEAAGPDSEALRRSLALNLVAVTGQRLFPRLSRPGRVPAYEWITSTPGIRESILSGDLTQLARQQESDPECRSPRATVESLIESGEIPSDAKHSLSS